MSGSRNGTGAGSPVAVLEVKRAYRPQRRPPLRPLAARTDSLRMLRHGDGAHRVHVTFHRHARGRSLGSCRGRPARPLRRQPQRQDHMQGGEAARDRARTPVAPRVPVHARRRRGRGRVRMNSWRSPRPEGIPAFLGLTIAPSGSRTGQTRKVILPLVFRTWTRSPRGARRIQHRERGLGSST